MRADNPSLQPEDGDRQFVTFSAAGERFAVPMGPVQEIIRLPEVARLPMAPPALEGLANLRGRILPIIDLRRVLGVPVPETSDATRALVIHIGQPLGFVVDHVASVIHASGQQLESAQSLRSVVDAELLTGVIRQPRDDGQDELLLVLDFHRLVQNHFSMAGTRGGAAAQTAGAAARPVDEGPAADEVRLVSFTVDGQEYAVDIADVQEIVQMPSRITALHNVPPHVLGLMSLRRRLLPLVSLRALFGLPPVANDEQQRIVVVGRGNTQIGLVTDTVKEVLGVPRSLTDSVPPLLSRSGDLSEFSAICRLEDGRRLVSVIDAEQLLGLPAIQTACEAVQACGQQAEETSVEETTMQERPETSDTQDLQMVIFRLGAEEFGVPIMSVQEIVRVPEVLTRVPQTPAFVEGVMNLRGMVLPVVDQRRRLAMDPIERNDRQRIMVYTFGGLRTGFIVDSVAEVMRIEGSQVEQAPDLGEAQRLLFSRVAKIDGGRRLVMLIDPDRLLDHHDRSQLALQAA